MKEIQATCLVTAEDYRQYWGDGQAPDAKPTDEPSYAGPERRIAARGRRYTEIGGRRRWDRKS